MAELNQGIKYTIEADASKAEKTLQDVGKQAAQNGQQIEKAMAGANAVTSALNGNFVGAVASLGRMTKAVSGLGKVIAGATGWIAIIGAVVAVFKKWRDSIAEAKEKIAQFKQVKFDQHLANMKKAQEELTAEIEKTVSAIDKQLDADTRALDIIKEKTKAQIELNRQKDLEGKSTEEKERINANANAQLAQADREAATAKLAAQIAAQGSKTEKLKALLKRFDEDHAERLESYQDPANRASDLKAKAEKEAMWKWLGPVGPYEGNHSQEMWDRAKLYVRNNPEKVMEAMSGEDKAEYDRLQQQIKSIEGLLNSDWERREKLTSAISDSEAREKELAQQKEIDKIKQQAAIQAEKNIQVELGKVRLDAGKQQAKDLAIAQQGYLVANEQQKNAESRLAAAKSAVQRAWGFYRDKDAMKAQMEEEKANAEAERQYEKDFDKLRFRRDWRTAKNLSVDEEATRRVALAKEEEAAAQKAVTETAANTARAAESLEQIQAMIAEGGEA